MYADIGGNSTVLYPTCGCEPRRRIDAEFLGIAMGKLGLIVNRLRMPSLNTIKLVMSGISGAPLYALTVEQFVELLDERINAALTTGTVKKVVPSGHYVYGIRGIEKLFGVSHKTAQYYKDHIINEAVMQNGRKIVVDADLALQLFNERRSK